MAIQIADGFQLRVAKPLDDRQNVETVAQLDPTYGYEGQIVYVKNIKQFYTCYKDENGNLAYKVMETGSSTPNESAGIELWVSGETYEENDFVSYNDYIYRCKIANNDADFVEDNWQKQSDTHVEITEQEILDLLSLTDEELETMASLIDDSVISLNKTHSSSKIYADIQKCLQDSKDFTLEELSGKIMSGSTVKDVPVTYINTFEDETYIKPNGTNLCSYYVSNGNCVVTLEVICLSTSINFNRVISGLPKSKTTLYANTIDRMMPTNSGAKGIFQLLPAGALFISCDYGDKSVTTDRKFYISFSYPVAE